MLDERRERRCERQRETRRENGRRSIWNIFIYDIYLRLVTIIDLEDASLRLVSSELAQGLTTSLFRSAVYQRERTGRCVLFIK